MMSSIDLDHLSKQLENLSSEESEEIEELVKKQSEGLWPMVWFWLNIFWGIAHGLTLKFCPLTLKFCPRPKPTSKKVS